MKKLLLIALCGVFFVGCKVKKKVTYGHRKKPNTTQRTTNPKSTVDGDGRYAMPEDKGRFVRYSFNSVEEYIDTFSEIAQLEMKTYGIPASITLAQGLLESGFGRGELALKTNNHFGIKCHKGWSGDYELHDDDAKGECFRKYNHPMYSYRDHSEFLKNRSRYAFLFNYRATDYKKWATGLRKAGYATDKRYPQKLISLIEKYQLHRFDKGYTKSANQRRDNVEEKVKKEVYIVKKGDTLYSISKKYAVSVDDLKRWNYMYDNTIAVGQKLTVQIKKFN